MRLTVVGAGLIGGSVGLAARARGIHVSVIDRPGVLASARARGVCDAAVAIDDDAVVEAELARSDLTLLAAPVGAIVSWVPRALAAGGVVTDVGSTKRDVLAAAAACRRRAAFVGGHPMAGAPQGGVDTARADLFDGRTWLLVGEGSDPSALQRVGAFVASLGARVVELSAEEHDRAVALTSHVPQIVASALAALAADRQAVQAAGPAFERFTRTAGGAESMWRDVFATNADEVAAALRLLSDQLGRVASDLEAGRLDAALTLLAAARGKDS